MNIDLKLCKIHLKICICKKVVGLVLSGTVGFYQGGIFCEPDTPFTCPAFTCWMSRSPPRKVFMKNRRLPSATSTVSSFFIFCDLCNVSPGFIRVRATKVPGWVAGKFKACEISVSITSFGAVEFIFSNMQSVSSPILFAHARSLLQNPNTLESLAPIGPFLEKPDESAQFPSVAIAGFDSGIAIILVALLFSILCTLGVAAVLRRSRRQPVVSEPSLHVSVERAKTGIGKMDLAALPARVYSTSSPLRALDCPICLSEFLEGEKVRVLPDCCHSFHGDCIDAWLISKPSCPSCRKSLLHVGLKKPAGVTLPAAEADERAGMDVSERHESFG